MAESTTSRGRRRKVTARVAGGATGERAKLEQRLAGLLQAASEVQGAVDPTQALEKVADAVRRAGWGSVAVYLFQDWQVTAAAYAGLSAEQIAFLEAHRLSPQERASSFDETHSSFRVSRSYFIPAEHVERRSDVGRFLPSSRPVQPGDTWRPLDLAYVPLHGSSGEVIGSISLDNPADGQRPNEETFRYLEFFADLAARTVERLLLQAESDRARQALRESESKYRGIFNESVAAIYVFDAQKRFVDSNQAGLDLLGYSRKELLKLRIPDVDDDPLAVLPAHAQLLSGDRIINYQHRLRRKDGSVVTVLNNSRPLTDSDGKVTGMQSTLFDITERDRAAEALRESEQKLRDIIEHSTNLFYAHTTDRVFTYLSPQTREFFDCEPDEALHNWKELITDNASNQVRVEATCQAIATGQRQPAYELEMVGKKGRKIWVEVHEAPVVRGGRTVGIVGALTDITKRKQIEREREELDAQLRHAQKMEAVGQLAGGVAHDFNNLLTIIAAHVAFIQKQMPAESGAQASLVAMDEAVSEATEVTRSLLTFTHKLPANKKPIDMCAVSGTAVRMFCRTLPSAIELDVDLACDPPPWIHADPIQWQQVVLNLAVNARDAMPEGGMLRIAVSSVPADGAESDEPATARLVVSDTGSGMSLDVCSRIFEPFFTTKTREQGTGLGLAVVHSIVKDHGGDIRVDSAVGGGSTFTVEMPCVSPQLSAEPIQHDVESIRGRGEVILLAEDQQQVRELMAGTLVSQGYGVLQAADGDQLAERFEQHRTRVRLLVLDVDLPKRSGLSFLGSLRAQGINTSAIVVTGSVGADLDDHLHRNAVLLQKPFQMSELAKLVHDLIKADVCSSASR